MKRDAKKEHIKLQRPSIIKCKGRGHFGNDLYNIGGRYVGTFLILGPQWWKSPQCGATVRPLCE